MSVSELGVAKRSRVCALLVVVFVAVAVSGCTKSDPVEASVWDMPEVVWDTGVTPSGGAEDSPWAKEFRAARFATTYVWATVDTSYAEYVEQFGYDDAVSLGEQFDNGTGYLKYFDSATGEYRTYLAARWSAQRLMVTNVLEEPGGDSAIIEYTFVLYGAGFSDSESTQRTVSRLTHNDDGTISLDGVLVSELPDGYEFAEEPRIEDIPTARWATPITKPTLPGEVKMPLPREYYVELGVISE